MPTMMSDQQSSSGTVDTVEFAAHLARLLYNDATLDDCTEAQKAAWLNTATALMTIYDVRPRGVAQRQPEPAMWVCLVTPKGEHEEPHIRAWTTSAERAKRFAQLEGLEMRPLYASPVPSTPDAAAQAAPLPDRERMAEILYTAAHKGLRNCWKWSDAELDHEHPTSRGYWYKIADGTLSALSSTHQSSPAATTGNIPSGPRPPASAAMGHSAGDDARCEVCDWPLADSRAKGCVPGDCSYRPDDPAEQERIRRRRAQISSTEGK